jgi:predicted permease
MKRRIRKIVNFFAFNLLFFALYLNFIHKDNVNNEAIPAAVVSTPSAPSAYTGTVLVQHPEKYLNKEAKANQNNQQ